MIEFGGDIVVRFVCDRGFSHELVRHRIASYAQESTRYCAYSSSKFGHEVTFITPLRYLSRTIENTNDYIQTIEKSYLEAEKSYLYLTASGIPVELARDVLPIGLKTEIVIKANLVEWRHIFSLRCSQKAHPRMRQLMIPLLRAVSTHIPVVFDDIATRYQDAFVPR
jgi:thymidylate synthase (FAD)